MGRILRREHENKRSAFAALLTTGMLAAILALAGLAAPSPAYAAELQSLSSVPQLTCVMVSPVDQTPSAAAKARFTAYTNVDDMPDAKMAYTWEKRDLDSGPDAWTTLAGKTTREIELDPGAAGYVRCTVTYTAPADALAPPLPKSVTSTNEARVRIMPATPANLAFADIGQAIAKVSWTGDANGAASDLRYRAVGSSEWTSKPGLSSASADLTGLKPGTMYEWSVRSVAYGVSGDPLCSDWVAGPLFTTNPEDIVFSRSSVTPSATSVMAGAEDAVTLTANTDADTGTGSEQLTYQWQLSDGTAWTPIGGATASTLQVSAKDLSVGEHIYRCEITATRGGSTKTLDSSESVVTAMPAAPTGLSVSDEFPYVDPGNQSGQVKAAFSWTWGSGTLPEGARFEVNYRKLAGAGAINDEWLSEGLTINNESRTCRAVLEARNITYQWRVRIVQNGATSPWSEVDTFITAQDESTENLSYVKVTPSDSLVDETTAVTLTASTNADSGSTPLTYAWEWCELKTNDPRKGETTVWTSMDGKTSKNLTLSGDERNRYVRCKVTQTVGGTIKTVASNLACVRTEPMAPENASAKAARAGTYDSSSCTSLSWECKDPRAKDDANKIVIGYEVNYRKVGASEWVEKICNTKNCPLTSLEFDATYEWRVRTILSDNVSGEGGYNPSVQKVGPYSEWVDGPVFTAPKVVVTPTEAAAVIGSNRTLTFTAMPNAPITNDRRDKTYQWERHDGTEWAPVSGATSETLSIVANDAATAGASRYRCMVTLGEGEYRRVDTTSNEVACTLTLAAPTNLTASDIASGKATLAWDWGGSQTADEFKVFYREAGATEWEPATATGNVRELALEGLKPETAYEWRVQAVQNGVESQSSFTSLFVTTLALPEPVDYEVTAGANGTWQPGQADLSFTINGDLGKFVSLAVDGAQLVRDKDYTAASGSTVITLSDDYLATLSAGTHTLVATYTDGTAETTFIIAAADKPTPPPPSDGNNTSGTDGGDSGAGGAGAKPLAPTGDPLGNAVGAVGVLGAVCAAFAAIAAVRLRRRR